PRAATTLEGVAAVRVEAPAESRRGSETVLLVEDEEGVRRLAKRVLKERGYEVLEAASGAEALELAKGHGGPIDLAFTDVVMPGMSGPELARALVPVLPGVPVLFMSGHPSEAVARHDLDPAAPLLRKPPTPDELARKVREVLDARGASVR